MPREKIKGSQYYRAFCTECGCPLRVPGEGPVIQMCEDCNPKHKGCSSPTSPIDEDAFKPSWKSK